MSLTGKRNDFAHNDLMIFASNAGLKLSRARQVINEVIDSVMKWRGHAENAGVEPSDVIRIEKTFGLGLRET